MTNSIKPPKCLKYSNFRESSWSQDDNCKSNRGREHAHTETITNMQWGNIAFPLALVFSILTPTSFGCLLNSPAVYSNLMEPTFPHFDPSFLSAFIFFLLSSAVILWSPYSATQSPTTSWAWPLKAATTCLQTPAIFLIYSSLFSSTSCCSLHCSKFFNLPCWVLARGNRSLPPNRTSIGPLQALTPGSFISFLSWHVPSCILPKALMQQWKSFWK